MGLICRHYSSWLILNTLIRQWVIFVLMMQKHMNAIFQVIIGPERTIITVRNLYLTVASERLQALTPQALALSLYKRFNQHIVSDSKHLQKQQLAFLITSRCHSCSSGCVHWCLAWSSLHSFGNFGIWMQHVPASPVEFWSDGDTGGLEVKPRVSRAGFFFSL